MSKEPPILIPSPYSSLGATNPAYIAALEALNKATGTTFAWDASWAPTEIRPKLFEAMCILGQAILDERRCKG